jgi:hypothetical protein
MSITITFKSRDELLAALCEKVFGAEPVYSEFGEAIEELDEIREMKKENASLRERVGALRREMGRYLPVLQHLENSPVEWSRFTQGLGIATLNGYKKTLDT